MEAKHLALQGLWLPLVTPFRDGVLDEASLRRLVRHHAREPIEGLTLDEHEAGRLVALSAAELAGAGKHTPLSLGCPAATRAGPQRRWSTPRNGRSTVISSPVLITRDPPRKGCVRRCFLPGERARRQERNTVCNCACRGGREADQPRFRPEPGGARRPFRAAREIKEQGTFGFAADALPYADANGFMLSMGLENNQ